MLIKSGGRRLYCDLAGPETGPVVCFAHSLSSDSGMWAEQMAPLLNAGWRVLRLDMRGHGGSDPLPGDYTMAALADDVALSLDFLGLERVHYVGLSIGGMLGQAFAIGHGHRLASAMFCDTTPASPPGAREAWGPRIDAVKKTASLEALGDGTMERWFTDAFKARRPQRWKEIRSTIVNTTPAGYIGCAAAIMDFDFLAKLPTLRVPTLVVCGDNDEGTPPASNKRIAELIPGGRYAGIADARHLPNIEQPEAFNRIMMEWLQSQRQGSRS